MPQACSAGCYERNVFAMIGTRESPFSNVLCNGPAAQVPALGLLGWCDAHFV
jgi:hypothetical protein